MNICPQCGKAYDDPIDVCPSDRSNLIIIEPSNPDPMLGKLLDGRYRLIRKIGEGGMGSIYRAVHTENLRICAIKLMTSLSPGKDDAIARFKREARKLGPYRQRSCRDCLCISARAMKDCYTSRWSSSTENPSRG